MLKLSVAMKPLSFKEEELRVLSSINFKKGTSPKSISTPRCSSPKTISPKSIPTPRPSSPRKSNVLDHSVSFKNWEPEVDGVGALVADAKESSGGGESDPIPELNADAKPLYESISPRPKCELDAAAVKVQKVYKSYRTRRNLADCAVVTEEMWWKALDFASLVRSSVSFFNVNVPETAVSKWDRARKRVAKVGKGLSKDEKAQKLALQHWLEAIDPRHRYGHNLHLYYQIWLRSESTEPFFYWLDVGAGKEIIHEKCPRSKLHQQCINYLGPNEREAYEVIVKDGKLVYKLNDSFVETNEGAKWIFVLSTSRQLYIGKKQKGKFQHSSFLSGAATTAAGRLVAKAGIIMAIWPYSGHYLPTEENFAEFISFLRDNNVDLTDVKKCSVDDDAYPSFNKSQKNDVCLKMAPASADVDETPGVDNWNEAAAATATDAAAAPAMEFCAKRLSCKWSSGTGARISCVRDYPADIQAKALEHVNLSPRVPKSPMSNGRIPIPSPRPSPRLMVSPRLAFMGLPSPRVSLNPPPTPRRS